jgi:hypothetical protein
MDVILWNAGPSVTEYMIHRTLGAYKIAKATRDAGYTAQVIDHLLHLTEEELYTLTVKFITPTTCVLGISTTFLTVKGLLPDYVVNVINRIGREYPKIKLVFGGYQASSPTGKNNIEKKDYACILEYGEDTFVELLKFYKGHGEQPLFKFEIKSWGLFKNYKSARNPQFNIETDNHLFTDSDCIMPNETLPIEISRGCIFKCKFCNHLMLGRGKLDYLRSMELIKNELLHNYEKWGITNYYVICDTFNDTEYKMKEWHKMVTSLPFKINYTAYLRADLLDRYEDVPYMLAESGLLAAFHGIETLGEKGSTVIGKAWSGKKARDYIPRLYHDIWDNKVYQTLSFIVGLPGDNKESINSTLDWFEQNDLHHMALHTLGMNQNGESKNLSEFERNATNYGYTFPYQKRPWAWVNDQWNYYDVEILLEELTPRREAIIARFGSWYTLMLMQYGFDKTLFEKKLSKISFSTSQLVETGKNHIQSYIKKLLAL